METLKSFLDQSLQIWKDSTAAARFGIGLLLLICVASVAGVGVWSAQPDYSVLASEIKPGKIAKLIDALEAADIDYIQQGPTTVLVDKRDRAKASREANRLGISHDSGEKIVSSPWDSLDSKKEAQRLNLQLSIRRMIEDMDSVTEAQVIISNPERQPFMRKTSQPKASVSLELNPHSEFGPPAASTIARMVANSVVGLTPDNVSVSDTEGNQYNTDPSQGQLTQKEEYRKMREQDLVEKAETILYRTLGFGNYNVVVTTEFSFPDQKTTSVEFKKEDKVAIKEDVESKEKKQDNRSALGPVGVNNNNGRGTSTQGRQDTVEKTETTKSEYRIPETEKIEVIDTPIMEWLSVSVIINSTAVEDENQTIPQELKSEFEASLREAVGIREKTKDKFSLAFIKFPEVETSEEPSAFATLPWDKINQFLKNLSLGLAALVALFVAFKALKKIQPDPSLSPETADRESQVDQLSQLVKENPEVFAKIMESWSTLDSNEKPEKTNESQAA